MDQSAPAWAFEKAEIHRYDSAWPKTAERECERLREMLRPWLVDGVEHVGSTAVPGLAAKPIVDVMASVSDPGLVVREAGEPLVAAGWCFVPPELDRKPWRRFFVLPDATGRRRVAHLHVIRAREPRWREQLVFRDALRRNEDLARRYAELKRGLSERYGHDREAYTDGKAGFVAAVLEGVEGSSTD